MSATWPDRSAEICRPEVRDRLAPKPTLTTVQMVQDIIRNWRVGFYSLDDLLAREARWKAGLDKDGMMNNRTLSQEYLNKVSPMGNALTQEQSAHLRDLLIAEGRIGDTLGTFEDFIKDLEGEAGINSLPRTQHHIPDATTGR